MTDDHQDDDADAQADGPDLDGDDYADVPEEMAAAVAEDTTPDDGDGDASADDGGAAAADADDADAGEGAQDPADALTSGTRVGDVYCNALGMTATLARDRRGSGVDDRERQVDEYADMARQLDLDDFVNEWAEAHGGADELTPGQGILLGTTMFALAVVIEDPQLADELGQGVAG